MPQINRRARHLLLSRPIWNRRAWFIGGAAAVGLVAVGFALGATYAVDLFRRALLWNPYAAFLLTPLGFAFLAWITARYFPSAQGSGIPQTIAALSAGETLRRQLLGLPIAAAKVLLTIAGLAVGSSAGREGPSVQVGASIMFSLSRSTLFPYERMQRGLILAGGAAGIAAAFNAPLAGIVFAIEEMSRSFEQRTVSIVITAVIVSGILSLGLIGNYAYFGHVPASLDVAHGWRVVLAIGLASGLAGGLFSRLLIAATLELPERILRWRSRHPVLFSGGCGLALACIGLASGNRTFGSGYDEARSILEGRGQPLDFAVLKFAATLVSYASGLPGGIFAPCLAIGAGLGQSLHVIAPEVPIATLALLGMAGFFSAAVQVPITAFVIVLEMTQAGEFSLPLLVSTYVAFAVARVVSPHPIYKLLARSFRQVARDAPAATRLEDA